MLADGIRPRPIVILSDINMPGMDGLSLLREVKKVRPEIPVMMVTAYGDDERRRRATELGAAEFLTKPVDFDSLRGGETRRSPSRQQTARSAHRSRYRAVPARVG